MSKLFAMLETDFLRQPKFSTLEDRAQLAAVKVLTSPNATYDQLYQLPWNQISEDEADAKALLQAIQVAGIIDWDPDNEWVRPRGRHRGVDRTRNLSTAKKRIKSLLANRCPSTQLRQAAQAELAVAIAELLVGWNEDKKERVELNDALFDFLKILEEAESAAFVEALEAEAREASPTVRARLAMACSTLETRERHCVGTEENSRGERQKDRKEIKGREKGFAWEADQGAGDYDDIHTPAKMDSRAKGSDKTASIQGPTQSTKDSPLARQAIAARDA